MTWIAYATAAKRQQRSGSNVPAFAKTCQSIFEASEVPLG